MHAALTWAVLSRYAEANDAPGLYAAAALTNAARVLGRKHWLSDTVGGALLGGVLGHHADRLRPRLGLAAGQGELHWWLGPRAVAVRVTF
jgi:membrane-associated phospholipid phosphatase